MNRFLEPALYWAMAEDHRVHIEWDECASAEPAEWHPTDLEIFYSAGRCHHLALALARRHGYGIAVTADADPDGDIPHHVFAVDGNGMGIDILGLRPVNDIHAEFVHCNRLANPALRTFPDEKSFCKAFLDPETTRLLSAGEEEIARTERLVGARFPGVFEEIRVANEDKRQALSTAP